MVISKYCGNACDLILSMLKNPEQADFLAQEFQMSRKNYGSSIGLFATTG